MSGRFSQMKKSCISCKRYRDHLGGKMNCFLRRMTANSKDGMIMPNRFLNHFEGKISGTIKLESPNGNLYDVEVAERVNKTVLRCGWEAFVAAHHIEENDSVLFRHIENSRFEVLILDSDDCEKVIPCSGIKNTSRVQERRVGSVKISSSSCDDTTQSSGSKRFARCRRGSSSHRREIEKMAAKSSSSEESGEDSPENESFESDDLRPPPGPDYVLSRRSYLSDAEKDKVFALIQKIQPEVTVFVAIMRKCSVKPSDPFVVISKDYAAVHFPDGSATVTLQRPDKCKKWRPRFYKRKDGSACMLKGNWLDFVRDNRVQEGDICLFVPTKGGRRFTFTVHLLHAAAAAHSRAGTGVQRVGSCHGRTITKMASAVHIKEEPTDGENASSSESDKHGVSHESLESMDSDDPPEPSYFLPLRNCLSRSQKKLVEEKVRAIQSEIPIYVAIMKSVPQHRILEFVSRYAELHLPDRNQTLVLHCMGKVWKTKMLISNRKIRNRWFLSGGWSKFTRDNHLRVGDICLFELKKNERKLAMTVHIIFSEQC